MKAYHINIFYSEEDGGYIADIPDLKRCSAFGETEEEALREVINAKQAWLEVAKAEGKPVPEPSFILVLLVAARLSHYAEKPSLSYTRGAIE